jgi:hypothetical protein
MAENMHRVKERVPCMTREREKTVRFIRERKRHASACDRIRRGE